MGTIRIRLKVGDIFEIVLPSREKRYMQYVGNDIDQLGGDVVRIFKKIYLGEDSPSSCDIVRDEIDLYCHIFLKKGIREGFWKKYGHCEDITALKPILFKTKITFIEKKGFGEIRDGWRFWQLDGDNARNDDVLPCKYESAYDGMLFQPSNVINKITLGRFFEREDVEAMFYSEIDKKNKR